MHEPITIAVNTDATVANVTIPVEGNGTDEQLLAALDELREEIVPETVGALPMPSPQSPAPVPSGRTAPTR